MTACIGWDGPCPMWGQFHGCVRDLDNPHADRQHVCDCGARTVADRRRRPVTCGTEHGYRRHLRAGEPACTPCRQAHAAHQRATRNPQEDT